MRSVLRGGAARFLAGVGSFLGMWYLAARTMNGISFGPARFAMSANLAVCLTAGYVVALRLHRPTVHSAMEIEGRRSVFAGWVAMWMLAMIDFSYQLVSPGMGELYGRHGSRIVMEIVAFLIGGLTTYVAFKTRLADTEHDAEELSQELIDRVAPLRPNAGRRE